MTENVACDSITAEGIRGMWVLAQQSHAEKNFQTEVHWLSQVFTLLSAQNGKPKPLILKCRFKLALAYVELRHWSSAQRHLTAVYSALLSQERGSYRLRARVLNVLGRVHCGQGEWIDGALNFRGAIEWLESVDPDHVNLSYYR